MNTAQNLNMNQTSDTQYKSPKTERTKISIKLHDTISTKAIRQNISQRPISLFKTPLKVNPSWLSRVKILDAPDVLSSQWWEQGFERIYFRVLAENGEQFWVFRTRTSVYIHGFF